MGEQYGPYVRLWGISPSQFPTETATAEEIEPFLASIFVEALGLIKDVPEHPSTGSSLYWKTKGTKTYPASTAPVHLFERIVPIDALTEVAKKADYKSSPITEETWFLRRSVHEDTAKSGTATWDDFHQSFKVSHAETEMKFTASILSTKLHKQWDCSSLEIDIDGDVWVDWTLKYEHSVHKLPPPLKKRMFPVLQATASRKGHKDFLAVQIFVSSDDNSQEGGDLPADTIRGVYTSVERVTKGDSGIAWIMGTVSDARGILPMWVQKLSVPGQVAKDVSMFLEWINSERKA